MLPLEWLPKTVPFFAACLSVCLSALRVFTEGILAMDDTLIGVIEVKPRQLLEDGATTGRYPNSLSSCPSLSFSVCLCLSVSLPCLSDLIASN
eukprot:SAG22_NODE_1947_length_3277_cov_1.880743_3_plen_93_part_00